MRRSPAPPVWDFAEAAIADNYDPLCVHALVGHKIELSPNW